MSKAPNPRSPAFEQFLEVFREWGRQGGKTRAKKLTAEQRREGARKAAKARWGKATRKTVALAVITLAGLTACARTYQWNNPGATEQQFAKDDYDCVVAAENMRLPSGWWFQDRAFALYERCMKAKGYRQGEGSFTTRVNPPAM